MTKISNQRAYIPDEEINGLDYLPGTDFDQALKTVNFRVQDLGTHYNQVNGVRNFDYNFYAHSGSNPKPADGYFYSNSNEQDPNNITYFVFSKKTARFKDTTNFFESISTENPFDLIIAQKVDINTIFFFRIDSIETFSGYYKLNVSEVFFPNGKELSYTLSYAVFNLKSEGGPTVTKTSDLLNDGSDGTSTYVETDELGATAFSNDYNDLDNKPTIPTVITNHSGLSLDDGTNPHGTTKQDVGLGDVPNLNTTEAVNKAHEHTNFSVLNGTEESFTTALKNAYNSAVSWITTNGTNLINHLNNISNPHNVTKSQVGLGSVDNTSDIGKPISTATQTALDLKLDKVTTAGVERAYIINADGSQSTKATSELGGKAKYIIYKNFSINPMSDFTNWYRQLSDIAAFTPNAGVTDTNAFSSDQNLFPQYPISFAFKVKSINVNLRSNQSGVFTFDFAIRSFQLPLGQLNDGATTNSTNNKIVGRKIVQQLHGGSQPNYSFTGTEIDNTTILSANSYLKLYIKNKSGVSVMAVQGMVAITIEEV